MRWHSFVGKSKAAQVCKAQNFRHFQVIDFFRSIRDVVIIGMKSGEPPERRNIFQHEGKLVAAKENVQRRFVVESVIESQTDARVFRGDRAIVVRAVKRAD